MHISLYTRGKCDTTWRWWWCLSKFSNSDFDGEINERSFWIPQTVLKYNKECVLNAERNLQLCSAFDRIQLATDSCTKKKASVHAHIHKISMITAIPLTQAWKMLHYDGFYPYYFWKVWSLFSKIAVYNFVKDAIMATNSAWYFIHGWGSIYTW